MRDDLHKTVSLQPIWNKVLKKLSRDKYTPEMLAPLIVSAVEQEFSASINKSWPSFKRVIEQQTGDLFNDGAAKIQYELRSMQNEDLSVSTRLGCDIALGVLADHGMTPSFHNDVTRETGMAYARDQLEHIVAKVFDKHGEHEAKKVFTEFSKSLDCCDFCRKSSQPSEGKKSSAQPLERNL